MDNKAPAVLAGLFLSLGLAGISHAANVDDDTKARQGVVRCGGNQFIRQNGSEIHFTTYTIRNVSSTTPITVERLTFFDATGGVLFDSSISGFPLFQGGVLGPADNVLEPNQTTQLNSNDVILTFLPENLRPIQLEITWSAPERVLTLQASAVRIVRQRDSSGAQLAERSRDASGCRTIDLRRE
jgi:hypothetical protein